MHGKRYDWNAFPMAPPGTRAVIYEDPHSRTSWGPRATDAWYCGPSLDHYRNCKFFVPTTGAYRTSGSFDLFPQHCILPELTPIQHATAVSDELIDVIEKVPKVAKKKLLSNIKKAIRTIEHNPTLPVHAVSPPPAIEGGLAEAEGGGRNRQVCCPRTTTAVTTTSNPTAPHVHRLKDRTHLKNTRSNTPGLLPEIETEAAPDRRSRRLNPDAIQLEEKAITPNSFRIPYENPPVISQQDETVHTTSPSSYPRPAEGAPSFISQEVNSASSIEAMLPPVTKAKKVSFMCPTMFSKEAVNLVTAGIYYGEGEDKWTPKTFITASTGNSHGDNNYDVDVEHFCAPVVHPVTGETITQYRKLKDDPATKDVRATVRARVRHLVVGGRRAMEDRALLHWCRRRVVAPILLVAPG